MSAPSEYYVGIIDFQWCRSALIATCPDAAADVHRLEADSKFLRSLLIVSLLTAATLASQRNLAAAASIVAMPCFIRYCERRLKATTQACIRIIALHAAGRLGKRTAHDT